MNELHAEVAGVQIGWGKETWMHATNFFKNHSFRQTNIKSRRLYKVAAFTPALQTLSEMYELSNCAFNIYQQFISFPPTLTQEMI